MEPRWKVLNPDLTSQYDNATKWAVGVEMPLIQNACGTDPCGTGYHMCKMAAQAIEYARWPFSLTRVLPVGDLYGSDATKERWGGAKLLGVAKKPRWILAAEKFIASVKGVKWLDGHSKTKKSWKMFDTRDAARAAAWDAAWDAAGAAARDAARDAAWAAARAAARDAARAAARDAAWDAAWDAGLMARMEICYDLHIDAKHRRHAKARWDVWQRGYGLACDIDGELYCYRKP